MVVGIILLALVEFILLMRVIHYFVWAKVHKLTGIEQNCYVTIGGIKQYLMIRGENINNPIAIVLHDSTGMIRNYMFYNYIHGFLEDYTVIYWIRRGYGKTYYANPKELVTNDQLMDDLDELVDYLCHRFQKQKVVLCGYAGGSLLGVKYIKMHPEKVQTYISISQVFNMWKGLKKYCEGVLYNCDKEKRKEAHTIFSNISSIIEGDKFTYESFIKYKLLMQRLSKISRIHRFMTNVKACYLAISSPDMSFQDIRWLLFVHLCPRRYYMHFQNCINEMSEFDLVEECGYQYEVPFYMFYGENDYFSNPEMITEFYNRLQVPKKNLIEIQNSDFNLFVNEENIFSIAIHNILENLE